jgi:hypothetical protein
MVLATDVLQFVRAQVGHRIVSELCHMPVEIQVKHRHLRGDAEAHRCSAKSLIGTALVGFDVPQHARTESISKRAPSSAFARV